MFLEEGLCKYLFSFWGLAKFRDEKTDEVLDLMEEELDRNLCTCSWYFMNRDKIMNFTGDPIGVSVERKVLKKTCIYGINIQGRNSFLLRKKHEEPEKY